MSAGPLQVFGRIAGLVVLAGILGGGIGTVHRWYVGDRVPEGLAVLVGLSGVAVSLNTTIALGEVIGGDLGALGLRAALLNVATFLAAALAASAGARAGDHLGSSVLRFSRAGSGGGGGTGKGDVSRIVRSVGRVIAVDLPEDVADIGDIDGYDPVDPDVKAKLAGTTLVFPRRLTLDELHERFVTRLKTDYGVGYVDVEFTDDGEVEFLALGRREAGLGPTLPPGTTALAVRADPPPAVNPGDVVQVWVTDGSTDLAEGAAESPGPEHVTTGEVRGTAGDVVTLAVDEAETGRLDPEASYRLVTLPVEARADREFASVLRASEETMGVVTVADGSTLDGAPVGGLDVAAIAVRGTSDGVETIPSRLRILAPGETLYVVARPETLRRLEIAAAPPRNGAPAEEGIDRDQAPSRRSS